MILAPILFFRKGVLQVITEIESPSSHSATNGRLGHGSDVSLVLPTEVNGLPLDDPIISVSFNCILRQRVVLLAADTVYSAGGRLNFTQYLPD